MKILLILLLLISQVSVAQVKREDVKTIITTLEAASKGPSAKVCDRTIRKGILANEMGVDFDISVISEEYAQEVFNYLAAQDIPFRYPQDGCYARAHEMSRLMDKLGITSGKAFIEGHLKVKTPNTPTGEVSWWYHVAPVVKVRKNGKDEIYVFDPSIFDRPVPIEEWYDIQTKEPKTTYFTKRFNYGPTDRDTILNNYRREDIEKAQATLKVYSEIVKLRQEGQL